MGGGGRKEEGVKAGEFINMQWSSAATLPLTAGRLVRFTSMFGISSGVFLAQILIDCCPAPRPPPQLLQTALPGAGCQWTGVLGTGEQKVRW